MQVRADRPLRILPFVGAILLVAGFSFALGAVSAPGNGGPRKKPPQTRPTQTRPSQSKKAPPKPRHPEEKPRVYTNDDLKQFHSGPGTAAAHAPEKPNDAADPLKPFRDKEERARWRQGKIDGMQQRIQDLQAKLKTLDQKRLSILNPYVRRPKEEGSASEAGLSGPELLARTDAQIKEAHEQLEATQKELAAFLNSYPE